MGGGSGNSSTQTATQEPWAKAQPFYEQIFGAAQQNYNSGNGFKYYPDSTVVPLSSQTQGALGQIEDIANQGNPLGTAAQTQALDVLNAGGLNDYQRNALAGTYGVSTGQNQIETEGDYRNLLAQSGGNGDVGTALSRYVNNPINISPEFSQALDTQAEKLATDVQRNVDLQGRSGSAYNVNALTDSVGNLRTQATANEIARQQQNQLTAAGMLGNEQQRGFGNALSAIQGIGNTQGANIANLVGAGSQINQAGNQAIGNVAQFANLAPSIYDQQFAPAQYLAGAGAQREDLATRELNDTIGRFNANQQEPYNRLSAYNALLGGAGQLGGTSTTTATAPANYFAPFGGALAGSQIGSAFGPVGTGIGALGGGLLGLLGI